MALRNISPVYRGEIEAAKREVLAAILVKNVPLPKLNAAVVKARGYSQASKSALQTELVCFFTFGELQKLVKLLLGIKTKTKWTRGI